MSQLIHDRGFYKTFAALTLSLALQNLLTYSVNLADNLMIGQYSQQAMSAVSLCNQFQFFLQMLVTGVAEGVVVLGAQYWGKNNLAPIRNIIGVGLRFGLAIASVMFFLALTIPNTLLQAINSDPVITEEATKYLRIVCFTYLLFTLTHTLTASLRSIGVVKVGYVLSFSTLCINITLNYCLIYGNFGFPELGIQGAAIATLTSRIVELGIIICFLTWKEKTLHLTVNNLLHIDTSFIHDYIHVALPLLITQATWGIAQIIQTAIIGHLEDASSAIAANAIAVLVFQIISVVGYGAASAAAILTGKAVGIGDFLLLKRQTITFQLIFGALGILTGLGIYSSTDLVLNFYPTLTPETREIAVHFIAVMAITSVGTCYQMASDVGIIRAGGSPSFSMKNNTIFMWGIVIPSALISAFIWKLPAVAVFFCLKSDQLLKAPVIFYYTNSYKWIRKVTRE